MRYYELVLETAKQVNIQTFPKIGWWLDRDPVRLYHGTHTRNLDNILKSGIQAPTEGSTAGKVSLAIDPLTARAYASMSGLGGEHKFKGFRNVGQSKNIQTKVPMEERVVFIIQFPREYVLKIMNTEGFMARGHMSELVHRLDDKNEYQRLVVDGGMSEKEYYSRTEIRVPEVKPQDIVGYTIMGEKL
jgi:hypothetical protein